MSPGVIFLVVCLAVAALLTIASIVNALLAALRLKQHVDRTKAMPLFAELKTLNDVKTRLNTDLAEMEALLPRAEAAGQQVMDGLNEMRIPQAIAALRITGAAIRLLAHTLHPS